MKPAIECPQRQLFAGFFIFPSAGRAHPVYDKQTLTTTEEAMRNEHKITQSELKELLRYEPDTGHFYWLKPNHKSRLNKPAGTKITRGYIRICVNNIVMQAHALAFLYMTGSVPDLIDHKNGVTDHNRWENLRPCTHAENMRNRKVSRGKKVPFKGVSVYIGKNGPRYRATIRLPGDSKTTHLGFFDTPEAANDAYEAIAKQFHGDFFKAS